MAYVIALVPYHGYQSANLYCGAMKIARRFYLFLLAGSSGPNIKRMEAIVWLVPNCRNDYETGSF